MRKNRNYYRDLCYEYRAIFDYFFMKFYRIDRKSKPTTQEQENQVLAVKRFLRFSQNKMTRQVPFATLVFEDAINNNTELGQAAQAHIAKYSRALQSSNLTPEQREIMALTIEDLQLSQNQLQRVRNFVCLSKYIIFITFVNIFITFGNIFITFGCVYDNCG